jgi:hypothetical protein
MLALVAALGVMALALFPPSRWTCIAGAALNVVFAAVVTGYVLRTQPSFAGRSAWRLRVDAGEHALYFATMGVAGLAAVAFVVLAMRGSRGRTLRGLALASGGLDLVLGFSVFVAFEID